MEEKERYYSLIDHNGNFKLRDYETGNELTNLFDLDDLLNQQDNRIKELEETNKLLSNELTKNNILKQDHIETCCGIPIFEILKMKEENHQLKQQLAEKEQENERLKEEICRYEITLMDKNSQLKQQLAEKDKELSEYVKIVDDLHKQLSDKCDFCNKTKDQDKISFALEQLEKVKEFFLEEHRDEEMDTDYIITKDVGEIADYLLDQIKQLKEMKYDELF